MAGNEIIAEEVEQIVCENRSQAAAMAKRLEAFAGEDPKQLSFGTVACNQLFYTLAMSAGRTISVGWSIAPTASRPGGDLPSALGCASTPANAHRRTERVCAGDPYPDAGSF